MDIQTTIVDLSRGFDLSLSGVDLARDDGLASAVAISLFTDAQAREGDVIPHGGTDRRGWWGDAYAQGAQVGGDPIGSRLWLLPGKQLGSVIHQAEDAALEALDWLVLDGVAATVEVTGGNPRDGVLSLAIRVTRPDGAQLARRYEILWRAI